MSEIKKAITENPCDKNQKKQRKHIDYNRVCSVCDESKKRIDVHLEKVHLLKRGSVPFKKAFNDSILVNPPVSSSIERLEIQAGYMEISKKG